MSYCTNCGSKLNDGAKFCHECGESQVVAGNTARKIVYEGEIHKCPSCGEVLSGFDIICPSCGYELRGRSANSSVQRFYNELNRITDIPEKGSMIRNFPVPNTREDIFDFLILASSNILGEDDKDIFEAWSAKFEQTYQRALIVVKDKKDLEEIENIRTTFNTNLNNIKVDKINKTALEVVIRNIALMVGIVALVIGVIINMQGDNSSLIELVAIVILIASACTLPKRKAGMIDYAVGALGGVIAIILAFLLDNGSMYELGGGLVLIIIAVNFFRSIGDIIHK